MDKKIGAFDYIDVALVDKYSDMNGNDVERDIQELSMTVDAVWNAMNLMGINQVNMIKAKKNYKDANPA